MTKRGWRDLGRGRGGRTDWSSPTCAGNTVVRDDPRTHRRLLRPGLRRALRAAERLELAGRARAGLPVRVDLLPGAAVLRRPAAPRLRRAAIVRLVRLDAPGRQHIGAARHATDAERFCPV